MENSDEVIAFELWDPQGKSIVRHGDINSLPPSFQQRVEENFSDSDFRNIYRKGQSGAVRLIVRKNAKLFQGNKGVSRGCEIYLSLIPRFKQIENSQRQHFDSIIRRFAHNLIKFQRRFKGNFSRLISDPARARPFSEFQEEVKRRIESNTSIAAHDVCQMSHRAIDLDAQIETLRIISGYAESPKPENKIRINLQKALFRLTNPFREELASRQVDINVSIPPVSTGTDKVLVDPDLFNAAIWQLLDNASKYVKDGTQINITADLNSVPQVLEFSMVSVRVDEDELETVFLEGRTGRYSGKKGESGIGLFIVRKALGLMGVKIALENEGSEAKDKGYEFSKNRFIIEFPR